MRTVLGVVAALVACGSVAQAMNLLPRVVAIVDFDIPARNPADPGFSKGIVFIANEGASSRPGNRGLTCER